MKDNHNLLGVLKDKTIKSTAEEDGGRISFHLSDDSVLSLQAKADGSLSGPITSVKQSITEMTIGSDSSQLNLAMGENPAVIVRDSSGKLVYAD